MSSKTYGISIYRNGVICRTDGRTRYRHLGSGKIIKRAKRKSCPRGKIRGWSRGSARRLAFTAANGAAEFKTHLTLTYRALTESWETDVERNRRVILQSKGDLHRFLSCLRSELGAYLWVREFQTRGVLHYHLLAEKEVSQDRAGTAWARASGQLADACVLRHGVKADCLRNQEAARKYLALYVGKEKQKQLPKGIDGAGRWWGRSQSLKLVMLEEIVSHDKTEGIPRPADQQVLRCLKRYIGKRFRGRFRGGMFLDWGGSLTATLQVLAVQLREYFGRSRGLIELVESHGWEVMDERFVWEEGIWVSGAVEPDYQDGGGEGCQAGGGGSPPGSGQEELW